MRLTANAQNDILIFKGGMRMFDNLCFVQNKLFEKYGVEFHTYNGIFSKQHNHEGYWELFVITQGAAVHRFGPTPKTVYANYVQLMRPNDTHCFCPSADPCKHISISFDKNVVKNMFDIIDIELHRKLIEYDGAICTEIDDDLRREIEQTIAVLETLPTQENGYVASELKYVFFRLLQKLCASVFLENAAYPAIVREAIGLMQSRYADYLTVDEICNNLGCTHIRLLRSFKQHTGKTVVNYFLELKLEKAFTLLISTNYKVIEICSMVGIDSISYFNKKFKEKYGVTPTEIKNTR